MARLHEVRERKVDSRGCGGRRKNESVLFSPSREQGEILMSDTRETCTALEGDVVARADVISPCHLSRKEYEIRRAKYGRTNGRNKKGTYVGASAVFARDLLSANSRRMM